EHHLAGVAPVALFDPVLEPVAAVPGHRQRVAEDQLGEFLGGGTRGDATRCGGSAAGGGGVGDLAGGEDEGGSGQYGQNAGCTHVDSVRALSVPRPVPARGPVPGW